MLSLSPNFIITALSEKVKLAQFPLLPSPLPTSLPSPLPTSLASPYPPPPTPPSLDACSAVLSWEVRLDFTRTMNRILFDKTVTSQPGTFPFVTLPDPHTETVPWKGEYANVRFTFGEHFVYFQLPSL